MRRRTLKLAASLLLTCLFTWWAFRDIDWGQQWVSLKSANYIWIIPYFGILTAIHLCRTLRWGFLLSGLEKVPFRLLNEASGIGFMMLLILPLRLGEFARPFLIAQRTSIRRSPAMMTIVLERITDGLSIATLLRVLLFFVPANAPNLGYIKLLSNVMFALFGGGLIFLLVAAWHQPITVKIVHAVVGRVSPRAAQVVGHMVDGFVGALKQLPRAGQAAGFFALTAVYWALNGAGMSLLSRAFHCQGNREGCVPLYLSTFDSYVVVCVVVLALMVPAAPGMIGTFQAGVKLGLALFLPASVVNGSGLAYANVLWLCQIIQQIGFGIILMSLAQLSFREVTTKLQENASGVADASTP